MRARRDEGWAPPVRLRRWGIVVEPRTDAHSTSRLALWSLKEVEFDPGLSWDDVAWLQSIWSGPLVLKGIQTVEDARRACDAGVEGIAELGKTERMYVIAEVPENDVPLLNVGDPARISGDSLPASCQAIGTWSRSLVRCSAVCARASG